LTLFSRDRPYGPIEAPTSALLARDARDGTPEGISWRSGDSLRASGQAGSDGVEFDAANRYLLEQFVNAVLNKRIDRYGGGLGDRTRFLTEVADAALRELGPGRRSPTPHRPSITAIEQSPPSQ
jgi:hypothetical protein